MRATPDLRPRSLTLTALSDKFHTFFKYPSSLGELDQKEMADVFEAFLGAVSLESQHGEREADAWITALFSPSVFPDAISIARQVERRPVYLQSSRVVNVRKVFTPFRPTASAFALCKSSGPY